MGLGNIEKSKYSYVSFNNDNGKLEFNGSFYDYVEGEFLGVGAHEFEFKGRSQKKFDIYLYDQGIIYMVQFGFYTWNTYRLMNQLLNLDKLYCKLRIIVQKNNDDTTKIFVRKNGDFLKWKHRDLNAKLKVLPPDKKEQQRNKIIDAWYQQLLEKFSFDPEIIPKPDDDFEEEPF